MKCWYCKQSEMVEDKELGCLVCPKCRATYTELPKLGQPAVIVDKYGEVRPYQRRSK